jgi:hypothetical protein
MVPQQGMTNPVCNLEIKGEGLLSPRKRRRLQLSVSDKSKIHRPGGARGVFPLALGATSSNE